MLWFVGDYASLRPALPARLARDRTAPTGPPVVDFGILYDGERNSGNDVRRVGEEGLWEALAEENIGTRRAAEFNRIVTSDPHSLNTLRNEYPDLGGSWPVSHHTTFLLELIESGRLDIRRPPGLRGHVSRPVLPRAPQRRVRSAAPDPRAARLHAGRDAPQPRQLVLLRRRRRPDLDADEPGTERPSENRIREAVSSASSTYFVVACPKDVTMYEDAIKTPATRERLELRELTELLEEAVEPALVPRSGLWIPSPP